MRVICFLIEHVKQEMQVQQLRAGFPNLFTLAYPLIILFVFAYSLLSFSTSPATTCRWKELFINAAFLRPVFPRVPSAVRIIPCRPNRKNRCGSWACKCTCYFQRFGGKQLAHERKGKWADGVSASVLSRAAEIFAKTRAVGTARLFESHRPQSTRTNLQRLEVWPSYTPPEQGLMLRLA
ncbi:hypothetical protein AVEN_72689-1 [Araneus ventricosus]|uniref:Uncharacterized protein n=1 Tax=Araneus ventricosus TaxID=182803 RepID=A0A4Y2SEW5_ARAVE|nr:hypothetical protein AVEN_72689-1 [Araneus ventricosus]